METIGLVHVVSREAKNVYMYIAVPSLSNYAAKDVGKTTKNVKIQGLANSVRRQG